MKSWTTTNGYTIYRVLSGRNNAYLIRKNGLSILVDTGPAKALGKLRAGLRSLDITSDAIDLLILTHTHYDHCQSAREICVTSRCPILATAAAAEFTRKGFSPLPNGTNAAVRLLVKLARTAGNDKIIFPPFEPGILFTGNYRWESGQVQLDILETPGHTVDSLSINIDNEIAIVGDTLFGIFRNSVMPPFANNVPELFRSWGKLLETPCHTFLPGHGGAISRTLLQRSYREKTRIK